MKTRGKNIRHMHMYKKIALSALIIFVATFSTTNLRAQEKDTTKIKMGNNEIIIVNKQKETQKGIEDLKKGKADFENQLKELELEMLQLEQQLQSMETDSAKQQNNQELEKNLEQLNANLEAQEKKREAFEKGIEEIENEIAELEADMNELEDEIVIEDNNSEKQFKINRPKKFKGHWSGIDIGMSNFLDNNYKMNLPVNPEIDGSFMELNNDKSWSLAFNFMEINLPVFGRYAGFTTGLGFKWTYFSLKQNVDLYEDSLGVITAAQIDPQARNYDKNILQTTYFRVPLLFEFQIPVNESDKRLYCNFGVVGAVKINSKTKKTYEINGDREKRKVKGDYQLAPLAYDLTARIGYKGVQLFADYNMAGLFEKNKGPELYPFSVGIHFDL